MQVILTSYCTALLQENAVPASSEIEKETAVWTARFFEDVDKTRQED